MIASPSASSICRALLQLCPFDSCHQLPPTAQPCLSLYTLHHCWLGSPFTNQPGQVFVHQPDPSFALATFYMLAKSFLLKGKPWPVPKRRTLLAVAWGTAQTCLPVAFTHQSVEQFHSTIPCPCQDSQPSRGEAGKGNDEDQLWGGGGIGGKGDSCKFRWALNSVLL